MDLNEHIGIWDNFLSPQECQEIIEHYEKLDEMELSFSRIQLGDSPAHIKSDKAAFLLEDRTMRFTPAATFLRPFLEKFWNAWGEYVDHYSVLAETGKHYIRSMKVQKTLPGEGYHTWHFESDSQERSHRVCAFAVYLNSIESGGETEWLYQKRRVAATEGTLTIWPATYTHVHRGNPPLDGEKYLLTGWVEY
jgi:hypothetical protein